MLHATSLAVVVGVDGVAVFVPFGTILVAVASFTLSSPSVYALVAGWRATVVCAGLSAPTCPELHFPISCSGCGDRNQAHMVLWRRRSIS